MIHCFQLYTEPRLFSHTHTHIVISVTNLAEGPDSHSNRKLGNDLRAKETSVPARHVVLETIKSPSIFQQSPKYMYMPASKK